MDDWDPFFAGLAWLLVKILLAAWVVAVLILWILLAVAVAA